MRHVKEGGPELPWSLGENLTVFLTLSISTTFIKDLPLYMKILSIIYDYVHYLRLCPLFTTVHYLRLFINSGHFLSFIYDYVQYLRNRVHYLRLFGSISRVASIGFFFYFFLLFLIYLNSKFHKVVNMRHFSTHPYSKRKNNWILKISFLESPCSILSSYILFFFFWSDRVRVDFDHFCEATTILHNVARMLDSSSEIFVKFFLIVL